MLSLKNCAQPRKGVLLQDLFRGEQFRKHVFLKKKKRE